MSSERSATSIAMPLPTAFSMSLIKAALPYMTSSPASPAPNKVAPVNSQGLSIAFRFHDTEKLGFLPLPISPYGGLPPDTLKCGSLMPLNTFPIFRGNSPLTLFMSFVTVFFAVVIGCVIAVFTALNALRTFPAIPPKLNADLILLTMPATLPTAPLMPSTMPSLTLPIAPLIMPTAPSSPLPIPEMATLPRLSHENAIKTSTIAFKICGMLAISVGIALMIPLTKAMIICTPVVSIFGILSLMMPAMLLTIVGMF